MAFQTKEKKFQGGPETGLLLQRRPHYTESFKSDLPHQRGCQLGGLKCIESSEESSYTHDKSLPIQEITLLTNFNIPRQKWIGLFSASITLNIPLTSETRKL